MLSTSCSAATSSCPASLLQVVVTEVWALCDASQGLVVALVCVRVCVCVCVCVKPACREHGVTSWLHMWMVALQGKAANGRSAWQGKLWRRL